MTERVEEIRRRHDNRCSVHPERSEWRAGYCPNLDTHDLLTALAQAERERDMAEERVLESPLVAGCIKAVADLTRLGYGSNYEDVVAGVRAEVERLKETILRLEGAHRTDMLAEAGLRDDLTRVRAALEKLWWAACYVEVEPVDEKWGMDVRPRTLSEVMAEDERAEMRAALEGRG